MIVHHNMPLSNVVWYRIGGPARYILDISNTADLNQAIEFVQRFRPAQVMVIGSGSNLVFPDGPFDGAVIRMTSGKNMTIRPQGERIEVFGGSQLDDLVRGALDERMLGLEWAAGLPGTVGAAIRGNAGAFGGEISQNFYRAEIVIFDDHGSQTQTFDRSDLLFSYRESRVKHQRNWIVANATFQLQPGTPSAVEDARSVYRQNVHYRRRRHPIEYPNCGSVFKNLDEGPVINQVLAQWPDAEEQVRTRWHGKIPMGWVIGRLGLAGLRIGSAQVSEKHHNFIVNLGGATSFDVRTLIARIQDVVEKTFDFVPVLEVDLIE